MRCILGVEGSRGWQLPGCFGRLVKVFTFAGNEAIPVDAYLYQEGRIKCKIPHYEFSNQF
jgi:hypothetical protein